MTFAHFCRGVAQAVTGDVGCADALREVFHDALRGAGGDGFSVRAFEYGCSSRVRCKFTFPCAEGGAKMFVDLHNALFCAFAVADDDLARAFVDGEVCPSRGDGFKDAHSGLKHEADKGAIAKREVFGCVCFGGADIGFHQVVEAAIFDRGEGAVAGGCGSGVFHSDAFDEVGHAEPFTEDVDCPVAGVPCIGCDLFDVEAVMLESFERIPGEGGGFEGALEGVFVPAGENADVLVDGVDGFGVVEVGFDVGDEVSLLGETPWGDS